MSEELRKFPENYRLYDTSYGSEVPVEQFFIYRYDAMASKYSDGKRYTHEIVEYFLSLGFTKISEVSEQNSRQANPIVDLFILNDDKQIGILLKIFNDKNTVMCNFIIYYNRNIGHVESMFNFEEIKEFKINIKKSGISLVKQDMGHLDSEEYEMNIPDIDLELNYGKGFFKIHEVILKRLNSQNDKGIVLFHGIHGSGKTTYIKYLTTLIKDKEILFIPPSMAEIISDPSFLPFLMERKNSILIIEDAERVISDRETNGSSAGVSNILNLTDGILGDCLNIQVIATFNMKREKIDKALLRKGRLIAEHKFTELNIEETNILLSYLNKNKVSDIGLTLADIYNIDEEVFKTEEEKNKIGFGPK